MSDESNQLERLRQASKRLDEKASKELKGDGDYCSFCGKEKGEVERLIAGPSVLICNECVAECNRILNR